MTREPWRAGDLEPDRFTQKGTSTYGADVLTIAQEA
jgi:hypothetical protein